LKNLGVKNDDYEFVEIIGFDEELLAFIPQPVIGVLLIFPITEEVDYKNSIDLENRFPIYLA
jgi:ubiquitin carboxyl-terminal hydrolase L3